MSNVPKLKLLPGQEVLCFNAFSFKKSDDINIASQLHFMRRIEAGLLNSITLIDNVVISILFNNRVYLLAAPKGEQENFCSEIIDICNKSPKIEIHTETTYVSHYTGEIKGTAKEKIQIERGAMIVGLADIDDTPYFAGTVDDINQIVTVHDVMAGDTKAVTPLGKQFDLIKSFSFFKDVDNLYKQNKQDYGFFIKPESMDSAEETLDIMSMIKTTNELNLSCLRIFDVTFSTKDGQHSVTATFFDYTDETPMALQQEGFKLNFLDSLFGGISFNNADVNITFKEIENPDYTG